MRVLKVQATVRGYSAWVLERIMQERGELLADVTKYIIDRWADDNTDYLSRLGITRDQFRREEGGGQAQPSLVSAAAPSERFEHG